MRGSFLGPFYALPCYVMNRNSNACYVYGTSNNLQISAHKEFKSVCVQFFGTQIVKDSVRKK